MTKPFISQTVCIKVYVTVAETTGQQKKKAKYKMCIAFVAQHSQKMFRCEPHDENNGSRLGLPISTIVRLAFFILYSGSHFGNWVLTDTRASEACGTAIRRAQCTCKFGTFCTLYLPDGNFTQNTKDGGVRMREKERKREREERRGHSGGGWE